ncbi:MAG TPA: DUF2851 family protein [Flavobacterium sp.]|nr:DUF2851 family protein [Flavobacterium sp.]
MKEDFLHYVWRFKKLNTAILKTVQNNEIVIKDFGLFLGNEGPDFFNAKMYIDDQLWAGNVEMHINASDWYAHHHEQDTAYNNVILHVVWNDDTPILRNNGSEIPTLILKNYVSNAVFEAYNRFNLQPKYIFCEDSIHHFTDFEWLLWKEKLMIERLEQFTNRIIAELKQTQNNWEEAFYRLLLRNFGLNVNNESFYEIACQLPLKVLKKEQSEVTHLEALLLGTANLLEGNSEDFYFNTLKKTYQYLRYKYRLKPIEGKVSFYKLRPDNFPTIRLVQFARFFQQQLFLFDLVKNPEILCVNNKLLGAQASDYWQTHYVFAREHPKRNKAVSQSFYQLVLINTILPFQYVYHHQMGNDILEEILQRYQSMAYEKNNTTTMYKSLKVPIENSLDSQALLFLKKNYCDLRRCLNCDVGIKLMNR